MTDALARKLVSIQRNGDEWAFTWSQGTQVHSLKSNEAPNPDMINEMLKLHPYAVESAPWLSNDYRDKTYVSSVKFDWKGDDNRRNAVIILAVTGKPIKIPTDKKLADNNLDEKKKGRWDTNAVAQFDKLEERAFGYIDGERAQTELPLLPPETDNNEIGLFDDELDGEE